MRLAKIVPTVAIAVCLSPGAFGTYTNFESSQVHPVDLTPSGARLLVANTPDARLEVFAIQPDGTPLLEHSIPVGLEPVSVVSRTDTEAWVVNLLSDTVSVVDLSLGSVTATLYPGDEPTDVAFAGNRAFVTVAQEDALAVFDLSDLGAPPTKVSLFGRKPRALAVSPGGDKVYAVVLLSGNRTTIVNANEIFNTGSGLVGSRLSDLGLNPIECDGPAPSYPPLPPGVTRNPALTDPPGGVPEVGLIVKWDDQDQQWEDETGQGWNDCLPYRVADHDLFVIDVASLAVTEVDHLGTTLFEVSVNPANGKIYVPHTEARNHVRFEHAVGVQGHIVDNRVAIVDPGSGFSVTQVELNAHINRISDPASNMAERLASISQPGMLVWNQAGSVGYLTGIGSRKVFRLDGSCTSGPCIFGPNRAAPLAVEVGEGPTGVALLEAADRLYVLNRFTNSLAIVEASTMTKLDELALHDPSGETIRLGRRFLYDSILGSGHGDAACSSCHISGDRDDLAWDLGNPEGDFAPYSAAKDNVRFIVPLGGAPFDCTPGTPFCTAHDGFDPQKGPMTTQTLRGMLEPLHWRGDRATFNDFNQAFVGLMGTADVAPGPAEKGLTDAEMEQYRQFALGIRFPPNPLRNVDDTLPAVPVPVRGSPFSGNPSVGETLFNTGATDAGQPCVSCHTHPFGAAGGSLGGVTPAEPTSGNAAALFNGDADQSPHSDLKVAHLRNMYEKIGPVFGDHVQPPPVVRSGFGFSHDGAVPDLGTFFSISVFSVTAQQVRDISAFVMHFPTGTRPAAGRQVTLPAGTPPTGPAADESLLATLAGLGDLADGNRHCELVASALMGGRVRSFAFSGGVWLTDVAGEPALSTTGLRESADGPLTFLCATLDAGTRLGRDRDEDGFLNGDDCAGGDAETWSLPQEAGHLDLVQGGTTLLGWDAPPVSPGPSLRHEVLGGDLSALRGSGLVAATGCIAQELTTPAFADGRPDPLPGDGYYYLVRGDNPCGPGSLGPGRQALDGLLCP